MIKRELPSTATLLIL